jgi:hypothetical protein
MSEMIKDAYNTVADFYEDLPTPVKVAVWIGAGTATARTVSNLGNLHPLIGGVIDILALPFEIAISAAGDIVGVFVPAVESVTDPLIGDWSGSNGQQGAIGELYQMIK